MNAVVAEIPCRFYMRARRHAQPGDDAIDLARLEQRAMRCVVAEHKQARDRKTGERPQDEQHPPAIGQQKPCHWHGIEDGRLHKGDNGPGVRPAITRFGDCGAHVVQRFSGGARQGFHWASPYSAYRPVGRQTRAI